MRNTIQYLDKSFEKSDILSASMAVDTSLNERTLDVDTMQAVVKSESALTSFEQNTPVRFLRGGSQYALWYLMEITRIGPKPHSLSMTSSLGRLTQMEHRGGVYNGVAASVVIDEICGVVPHFIQAAFQNVRLYGWLPYVAPSGENGAQTGSAKDNLLQVLFALNATVRDDAEGTLRIENLSTAVSSSIGADRIYRDNANVVYEPTVTAVTVLEHQYIAGGDETTLFEGTTVDGQVIVFDKPMSNLVATGFTVTESNANYAIVSAGSGTLTGRAYIHTTREITKPVAAAAIPHVARIEGATLVGLTNSSDVVNRLVEYYKHRIYINVDATIDFEDAGDVVELWDPFDQIMRQACIEKISPLVVSQTMKGRVSALVGFTPWQVVPFEDERVLLTGSGTWTVPEGVTEITAVLIGGGSGGENGQGGNSSVVTSKDIISTSGTISSSPAGAGGSGGAGGVGGAIYRVKLSVQANEPFLYQCGAGGGIATPGEETIFGSFSSNTGAPSDAGFTDPVTGTTYGEKGVDGSDGGNGGSPGSAGGENGGAGLSRYTATSGGSNVGMTATANFSGAGGGGHGGASGNISGSNGRSASKGISNGILANGGWSDTGMCTVYLPRYASGGNGASAADSTIYGNGGNGGGGGGGGGGGAGAIGSASASTTLKPGYSWASNANKRFSFDGTLRTGGSGGSGGAGAPGCIILYYRKPVVE